MEFDDSFIWNSAICKWGGDKSLNIDEYLDYMKGKCRNRLINKPVENCDEDFKWKEMFYGVTLYDFGLNERGCKSCMHYFILLIVACISIAKGNSGTYLYFYRYIKENYINASSY